MCKRERSFLAVDAGNSRICFGLFKSDKFSGCIHVINKEIRGNGKISPETVSKEIIELNKGEKAHSCLISSVSPSENDFITAAASGACDNAPVFLKTSMLSGVKFNYKDISKLGNDRFAACAAARELYPTENVIIVDAGTAVTLGFLTESGEFMGGIIAPGPGICAECLSAKTASLPFVGVNAPVSLLGVDTEESIRSGIFYGFIEMVDGLVRKMKRELKINARVLASGGWSGILAEYSKTVDDAEPFLVLIGLRVIYEKNKK
jgi:type III pantothenate kinase